MGNPAVFAVEDHELYRLLIATYLAAFFSGMVDGATFLSSVTSVLTTHLTGATAKGGIYLVNGQADEEGWEMCTYVLVFFSGSLLSGVLTRRGELKSLVLLCNCFLVSPFQNVHMFRQFSMGVDIVLNLQIDPRRCL